MLGVTVVRQHLALRPCLPPHWPQATVCLQLPSGHGMLRLILTQGHAALQEALQRHAGAQVLQAGTGPWPLAGVVDGTVWVWAAQAQAADARDAEAQATGLLPLTGP